MPGNVFNLRLREFASVMVRPDKVRSLRYPKLARDFVEVQGLLIVRVLISNVDSIGTAWPPRPTLSVLPAVVMMYSELIWSVSVSPSSISDNSSPEVAFRMAAPSLVYASVS